MSKLGYRLILVVLAMAGLGGVVTLALARSSTVTVSSTDELASEIKGADSKDKLVVRLAPGVYSQLVLQDVNSSAGIVVESADPNNPAIVSGMAVRRSSGLTFRNILFTRTYEPGQQHLVLIGGSSDILIENVELLGEGNPQLDKLLSGMMIRNCQDVQVVGSRFSRFNFALAFRDGKNISILRNELHDLRTDAIRGEGVHDLLVANNVIGNFSPMEGDHPDGIQLWTNNQKEPTRGIVIRDNLVVRDGGGLIQGVFVSDTFGKLPFENLTISGNLAIGTWWNGIMVAGAADAVVKNNSVVPMQGQMSWIRLENVQDGEVSDNRAGSYKIGRKALVRQHGNKGPRLVKGDVPATVRVWLDTQPELKANPGPYLKHLAGLAP